MLKFPQARAEARALLSAVPAGMAAGAVVGLALGGAYLAGGLAQDAVIHAKVSRLADAASEGFSEQALAETARDAGALAIARRHDPFAAAPGEESAGQIAQLAARLEQKRGQASPSAERLLRIGYTGPAAQPFRFGALNAARELECLSTAVYYEARGETPAGQAAVAQVVLNRVRHPAFPKSICAVVYQGAQNKRGCQFSFACDGSVARRREAGAWDRARRVAERALNGKVMPEVGNATHFHVASIRPNWSNLLRVAQVGAHVFYRFGGRAGAPGAFTAEVVDSPPEPALEGQYILANAVITETPVQAAAVEAVAVKPEPAPTPQPAS